MLNGTKVSGKIRWVNSEISAEIVNNHLLSQQTVNRLTNCSHKSSASSGILQTSLLRLKRPFRPTHGQKEQKASNAGAYFSRYCWVCRRTIQPPTCLRNAMPDPHVAPRTNHTRFYFQPYQVFSFAIRFRPVRPDAAPSPFKPGIPMGPGRIDAANIRSLK